ncbi:MAG: ATP-binding protein, partial [Bacteroidota bacterium]|nr:ATP-binding protein [Bacteroidota bacterium]
VVTGSGADANRQDSFIHDTRIAGFGWNVRVAVDAQQAMLPVSGLQSRFLGVAILVALVMLVLLFFPVRFLIRPLAEMSEAARAMTEGDYSRRVRPGAEDEIGQLAHSFNVMAEATQERTEKLRNTARLLEQRTRELAVERDVLNAVLHSMHDAVLFYDRDGRVILQNAAGETLHRMLEEDEDSLLPRRCGCDEEKRDCRDCLRSGATEPRDCYVDAGARVFEVITAGIRSAAAPEGTLLVARDITTRMRIDERQAHRDRLAVLGEVSAVMAHELNNPLAAISMFTQLMSRDGQLLAKYGEHMEIIQRNTALCTRTIKDLLYYSRDSYRADEECDLHEVIPDVVRFLRPLYERAELDFHLQFDLDRAVLRCDAVHVRQVLVNLIMNALQATDGSGGRITVVTAQPTDAPEQVTVDVIDDGPGIPDELRTQVFEPFFTTKPSGEGTGLGLSISRRIVETLRGSLQLLSSRPGHTVFRLTLPRGAVEEAA